MVKLFLSILCVTAIFANAKTLVITDFDDAGIKGILGEGAGKIYSDSLTALLLNNKGLEIFDLNSIKLLNEAAKSTGIDKKAIDYIIMGSVNSCLTTSSKSGVKLYSETTNLTTITCSVKVIDPKTGQIKFCKVYEGQSSNKETNFGFGSLLEAAGNAMMTCGTRDGVRNSGSALQNFGNTVIGDLVTGDPNNPYNVATQDVVKKMAEDLTKNL